MMTAIYSVDPELALLASILRPLGLREPRELVVSASGEGLEHRVRVVLVPEHLWENYELMLVKTLDLNCARCPCPLRYQSLLDFEVLAFRPQTARPIAAPQKMPRFHRCRWRFFRECCRVVRVQILPVA